MKRIYSIQIAVTFLSVLLFNCNTDKPELDYAVIHGKIDNYKVENSYTFKSYKQKISHKLNLNERGEFNDTIKLEDGEFVFFQKSNNIYLTLNQGDNLKMSLDGDDFINTLKFEGEGAKVNNCLIGLERIYIAENEDYKGKYNREEADFKKYITEFKTKKMSYLESLEGLVEEFVKEQKLDIQYEYLYDLQKYAAVRGNFIKDPDFKASETFYSDLEGLDKENVTEYKRSGLYRVILDRNLKTEFEKSNDIDPEDYYLGLIKFINSNTKNQEIKNELLFRNSVSNITYAKDLDAFVETFTQGSTNVEEKDSITKIYKELKVLSRGNPSPKFVDLENHAGGTTSLDDLKGKYVYIDVWATWCGPCKAELPFLKKVEANYHYKNIEFVSISVDREKDHDKWQKMVTDDEMGGVQLFADKDWSSDFVTNYMIKGIPRFILIDTEGNIVSANAPRPSNGELIDLFNELGI